MGGTELQAHAERVRRQRAAARRRRGVLEKWREQRHGLVCDAAGRFQALVEEARAREERDAELLVAEARRSGYVCVCIRLYVYIESGWCWKRGGQAMCVCILGYMCIYRAAGGGGAAVRLYVYTYTCTHI